MGGDKINQKTMIRFIVVLGLKRLSNSQLIALARGIYSAMTGNLRFITPSPSLVSYLADIVNMETAMSATAGGPLKTATIQVFRNILELSSTSLGGYVETIANLDVSTASETILSAGMRVKRVSVLPPNDFRVKIDGAVPGEAKLRTKAVKRGTFQFQCSQTPSDDASWVTLYVGTKASCTATGLVSGKRYYFRVTYVDKNGTHPWSTIINIVIP